MVGEAPTRGWRMFAMYLATPYIIEPLQDTMGLRQVPVLQILGKPYNLGVEAQVGVKCFKCSD